MQNKKRFHFFSYRPAIRFHIANQLMARGWEKTEDVNEALFQDANLILNDEISKNFEYKHLLGKLLSRYCPDIIPLTYSINDENCKEILAKIRYQHYRPSGEPIQPNTKWILKPALLNNGDLIKLFNHVDEMIKYYKRGDRLGGEHVIQRYIADPDLFQGRKYTFRIHAVLTNYAGVFLYKQGYINISAHPFNLDFTNRKVHITNYVLDGELSHIEQCSTQDLLDFAKVYSQMQEIVRCCVKALLKIAPTYLKPQKQKIFEIFGFDFILDKNQKLWLIEINQGPDAPTFEENRLKSILWQPFWQDIIEEFVIPIALDTSPQNHYAHYTQVLSKNEGYSIKHKLLDIFGKNSKNV